MRANFFDFFAQALQLGVAAFDFLHSFGRALAKRDHFRDRTAVLALQSFEKRNALLERGELFRIEIEFFRVIGEGSRDFRKLHDRCRMFGSKLLRGDVDLFQLAYQALRLGQLG